MRHQITCTLQIEFYRRQQATRFTKIIRKDKLLKQYFVEKAERCIWLQFKDQKARDNVKQVLLRTVIGIEVRYRDSGIEYLFAQ